MSNKNDRNKIIPMRAFYDIKKEAENNTFGKRLAEARHKKGLSLKAMVNELASYNIHVQPSAVNKWEMGVTTPNAYQVFALCRLLDIEDGVRYFSGPLHPGETALNEAGLKKLEDYRHDLLASKKYVCEDLNYAYTNEYFDEEGYVSFPWYDLATSAGLGTFLDSDSYRMVSFNPSTVPPNADYVLTVSGDSMLPNYTDGQMVWVQKTSELNNNEIGIFALNGNAYIKMYKEVTPNEDEIEDFRSSDGTIHPKAVLVSLNKKYAPIEVSAYDNLRILGRVLTK